MNTENIKNIIIYQDKLEKYKNYYYMVFENSSMLSKLDIMSNNLHFAFFTRLRYIIIEKVKKYETDKMIAGGIIFSIFKKIAEDRSINSAVSLNLHTDKSDYAEKLCEEELEIIKKCSNLINLRKMIEILDNSFIIDRIYNFNRINIGLFFRKLFKTINFEKYHFFNEEAFKKEFNVDDSYIDKYLIKEVNSDNMKNLIECFLNDGQEGLDYFNRIKSNFLNIYSYFDNIISHRLFEKYKNILEFQQMVYLSLYKCIQFGKIDKLFICS